MTTDITELAQRLKAAAENATPGEWHKGRQDPVIGIIKIYARTGSTKLNCIVKTDAHEVGFGISEREHKANAELIALANPANILALVEALEKAQKSKEFLKGQLSELANFNPDWDKLEASYESWREIAAELLVAKDRIAELESRTVTVKLPDLRRIVSGDRYVWSDGAYNYSQDVNAALTAAGIKWEAE